MNHIRSLVRAAACALPMFAAGPASATDATDVATTINKWIADFNKGDMKTFVAACAPHASVIDDFAPYAWPTCADWINGYEALGKSIQATGGTLAIGKASHAEVTRDHAYMVFPATFSDTEKGKPVVEKGTWTMTLQKTSAGWVFTGSAWATQ